MTKTRVHKTAADYLAIGLGPLLIMALVGSLTFFLLEISYEGEYLGRLRWSLFWFVLAIVLVSRIAIVEGSAYASLYGLGLAVATGMMIYRFLDFPVGVWVCLAVVWWSASKLTWDCTLIDDEADSSGEGLLQRAGLDKKPKHPAADANAMSSDNVHDATWRAADVAPAKTNRPPWWGSFWNRKKTGKPLPHAPGLWVVYFSIAALPIFGIGQLLLPEKKPASRYIGFILLAVYLTTALALLLTTSFLGLRRYLRQRRLHMPGTMVGTWIGVGSALILAILVAGVLLPRPDAVYSLTAIISKVGSPSLDASDFGIFEDGPATDGFSKLFRRNGLDRYGRPLEGDEAGLPADVSGIGNQGLQSGSRWSQTANLGASIANLLRWLVYALLVAAIVWLAYRHRDRIKKAFCELINAFAQLWAKLFGWRLPWFSFGSPPNAGAASVPSRPFSTFRNPFASGQAQRWSVAELIQYTFEALQAWAREYSTARRPEQTPFEFTRCVCQSLPPVSDDLLQLGHLYSRLAYANRIPESVPLNGIERLWNELQAKQETRV